MSRRGHHAPATVRAEADMDNHKLYRPDRVPVGPNRLSRLAEIVLALCFVLAVVYLVR